MRGVWPSFCCLLLALEGEGDMSNKQVILIFVVAVPKNANPVVANSSGYFAAPFVPRVLSSSRTWTSMKIFIPRKRNMSVIIVLNPFCIKPVSGFTFEHTVYSLPHLSAPIVDCE